MMRLFRCKYNNAAACKEYILKSGGYLAAKSKRNIRGMGSGKKYTKNQILEFYLNNIYFSNGYYGVGAAARGYFDKEVSELTLAEQVFIAAIPNNPTRYNPLTNYDNTVGRRDLILESCMRMTWSIQWIIIRH